MPMSPQAGARNSGVSGMPGSKPLLKNVVAGPGLSFGAIKMKPVESAAAARKRIAATGGS